MPDAMSANEVLRSFQKLPAEIQAGVLGKLRGALIVVQDRVRMWTRVKWRRGAGGLSGRLTSFAQKDSALGIDAAIGFRRRRGFPYELAQEIGARAKAGKAMAIPVSAKARRLSDAGVGPRSFPGKLFIPPHTHVLAEAYQRGAGKGGIKAIHYSLVKSIPARLRFFYTAMRNAEFIGGQIEVGAKEGLKKA
jgi:hypothetical protein